MAESSKVKPDPVRAGTVLYPGFYGTVPAGFGRIQRLEKGSQRLQRGSFRPTSGSYARLPIGLLTGSPVRQTIQISNNAVKKVGGASISGNTLGFAYTATSTSITWYWDGTNSSKVPVITRNDGSRFTVPTSGSPITITGLSPSTTYYFLPFWDTASTCNVGWVPGTVGSPQIAFIVGDTTDITNTPVYLMEQTTQTNEPLSTGFMSAATPASGSGGGGAGGGGGGGHGCVMSGTEIETLGDIPYTMDVLPETQWVHLRVENLKELYCSLDHPLFHAIEGKRRADMFSVGDLIITDEGEQRIVTAEWHRRVCSKWKLHMPKGHLYWANGYLSHNFKPL